MGKILTVDFDTSPVKEWVYDPSAFIPVWVARSFHKLGSTDKLYSLVHGILEPGDKVRLENRWITVIKKNG